MHIGGTKGKERKGFVVFFLFLGQSQIQLPSFSPPRPSPLPFFRFRSLLYMAFADWWITVLSGEGRNETHVLSVPCRGGPQRVGSRQHPGSLFRNLSPCACVFMGALEKSADLASFCLLSPEHWLGCTWFPRSPHSS